MTTQRWAGQDSFCNIQRAMGTPSHVLKTLDLLSAARCTLNNKESSHKVHS